MLAPALGAEESEFGFSAEEMFPAVSFEPLTPTELDSFIAVFPSVAGLLDPADYDMKDPEDPADLPGLLVGIIEGLREVDGVEAALSEHGMDWGRFSATIYKIMAVYFIVVEDIFSDIAFEISGEPVDKAAKNRDGPGSAKRDVLEQNLLLMKEYEEQFEGLGDILR